MQDSEGILSYGIVRYPFHILYENHVNKLEDLKAVGYPDYYYTGAFWTSLSHTGTEGLYPDIKIDLVDNSVHSPPYAGRCQVLQPWLGEGHYRISVRITTDPWNDYYASCWHYFPSDWRQDGYVNIMAYKERSGPEGRMHAWRMDATPYPEYQLRVWRQYFADKDGADYGGCSAWLLGRKLPLGRWFRTTVFVHRHKTDGIIRFWLDDKLIFERTGVMTENLPWNTPSEPGDNSMHEVTVHFCYVKPDETNSFINYFDDIIIADRFISTTQG